MAQASFGYFGMGVESAPGTAVPPTKFLPVTDVDFPIENEFIERRYIRGSRQAYKNYDGPLRPSVTFTTDFYPGGAMGVILRGLFGSVATADLGATAKVHTFGDAVELPSISMERSDSRGAGGVLLQRLNGCKIESFSVSAAFGEAVTVDVTAQGLSFPDDSVTKPATFTAYPTMDPFIFYDAVVEIDGTPSNLFKTLDFEINNTLERQESLRGTRTSYAMYEGGMECSLSGTLIYDDDTLYNKLRDSDTLAIRATFMGAQIAADGPGPSPVYYKAEFYWPNVKVATFGNPMTAGDVMEADVDFQVSFDDTAQKLVECKLTNLDASGAYAV